MKNNGLQVGHLVKLISHFDGIKSGVTAYVYKTEPDYLSSDLNAAYLISSTGANIGRMSVTGQNKFLMFLGDTEFQYEYDGDVKLSRDWMDGVFEPAFSRYTPTI